MCLSYILHTMCCGRAIREYVSMLKYEYIMYTFVPAFIRVRLLRIFATYDVLYVLTAWTTNICRYTTLSRGASCWRESRYRANGTG